MKPRRMVISVTRLCGHCGNCAAPQQPNRNACSDMSLTVVASLPDPLTCVVTSMRATAALLGCLKSESICMSPSMLTKVEILHSKQSFSSASRTNYKYEQISPAWKPRSAGVLAGTPTPFQGLSSLTKNTVSFCLERKRRPPRGTETLMTASFQMTHSTVLDFAY